MTAPLTTKAQNDALLLYAEIMEEAKTRLQWVEDAVNGRNGFHGQLIREVCYLQFRLICELIAFGCLVAHGDITAKTKLNNEYAADRIFAELFKLHPDFYPVPHNQVQIAPGESHFEDVTEPYLTRDLFKTLYVKTGSILHRGKLKKWVKTQSPILDDYIEIKAWRNKIVRLLGCHRLPMREGGRQFICFMTNSITKNVSVHWAVAVKDLGEGWSEIEAI